MNYNYLLLQCALRMEKMMKEITNRTDRCRQCRAEVDLTSDPVDDELYSHTRAADFLERSDRQVYRYRSEGKLAFTRDEDGHYFYLKSDLERLFEKLHGFPKGGFGR